MITDKHIGVLLGGTSAEREVSLKSGAAVSSALKGLGYNVTDIDVGPDVAEKLLKENIEIAFLALHGGTGEDGSIQGLLEVMGIPYTGSDVLASALAMDKVASKVMFSHYGLKVPPFEVVTDPEAKIGIDLPVVVKPSREGSSVGITIVKEAGELIPALREATSYEGPALVEKFIKGKEIQIGVLGDRAMGGVEVRPKTEFYSYEAKYTAGMTVYVLPPELDKETYERAREAGLQAHQALGCSGASRVDLLITEENEIYVLEVNTIPGLTETSLLPKIAGLEEMDFPTLMEEMLRLALQRKRA